MIYLAGWVTEKGEMQREGVRLLEAKSVYDAKKKFLKDCWDLPRLPMAAAITMVRARCLEDSRFRLPVSDIAMEDPQAAYDQLHTSSSLQGAASL